MNSITKIENYHFEDQKVVLDGHSFHNCTFENCALIVSGYLPFELKAGCEIKGSCSLELEGAANLVIRTLKALGQQPALKGVIADLMERILQPSPL